MLGRHEKLHYHIWFPALCATGWFASSFLLPAPPASFFQHLCHCPTTLQHAWLPPVSHHPSLPLQKNWLKRLSKWLHKGSKKKDTPPKKKVTYCLPRAYKPTCPPACELPGTHLVTFYITQCSPCQPQLVQFLLWKYKQDKKENVSECLVGMKNSISTYGSLHCVPLDGLLPASFSSNSQPLAHNTTTCLVTPCLTPPKPPPSKNKWLKRFPRVQKRRKSHQKKSNLLFAQGVKTYMSTTLCVAWDTLSYILYHTVFSLPATAGPISTVRVQAGQEGKCK